MMFSRCRKILFVLLFFLANTGLAQLNRGFQDQSEWTEQVVKMPPFPKSENLIKTSISGSTGFEFFVDLTSLEVGSDGVVRFVVIARSPAGAENISFEGIRCSTRERKLYGVGRANGTWFAPGRSEWIDFRGARVNSYHESFALQYFCLDRTAVPNVSRAIELLKRR